MKIINCHIETFGKLKDIDYNFNDGLNIIYGENGFGKTTLASFIKVMFYGFDGNRKSGVANQRHRYKPWDDGIYGGSITFLYQENVYTIKRKFFEVASKDQCYYYNLSKHYEIKDYRVIGEELFGLDSESFLKSLFISDLKENDFSKDSLQLRLIDLYQSDDNYDYDKALNKLLKAKNRLIKNNGLLNINKEKLINLQNKKAEAIRKADSYESLRNELESLYLKRDVLLKEKENKNNLINNHNYKEYIYLQEKLHNLSHKIKEIGDEYPFGVPGIDTVKELNREKELISYKEKELDNIVLSNNDINIVDKYKEYFKVNNVDKDLNSIEELINKISLNDYKIANLNPEDNKNNRLFIIVLTSIILILITINAYIYFNYHNYFKINIYISLIFTLLFMLLNFFITFNKHKLIKKNYHALTISSNKQKEELLSLFKLYGINTLLDYNESLEELNNAYIKYCDINKREKELKELRNGYDEYLLSLYSHYRLKEDNLLNLDNIYALNDSLKQYQTCKADLDKFLLLNPNINKLQVGDKNDEEINELYKIITEKEIELNSLNDEIERLDEYNLEITKVKTIIEEYEFKVDVYNKTIDYLKLAKDNLSLLYLDGLEKYFKEYAALLFKAKKPLVSIDKDLNISIYSKGFEHQLDYFSSGEIDGISLCLRLSLAKVLFKKEKPFFILDDPFVNMDDNNLKEALTMLEEIAKDNQVIYFTCNKSRILK